MKLYYSATFIIFAMYKKVRKVLFYKSYFEEFFLKQKVKVKEKILWTLELIEELDHIPEIYFKHLSGSKGLFEIRVQQGSDIFRIFCFFDGNNIIVITTGFQKKSQKTPEREIRRVKKIMEEYFNEKK
jgi:phage-related protein